MTLAEFVDPPFLKKLISNRGEIAIRILRTAKSLGIKTVAVYSAANANSPHVTLANEAVCIGPPASIESYLDIEKVCEVVEVTGAEGVHPRYGFLSKNSGFSERVAGLLVNEVPNGGSNDNIGTHDAALALRGACRAGGPGRQGCTPRIR